MASESTKERAPLGELQGVVPEDRSGELPLPKISSSEAGAEIDSEPGDDLLPALAWIKNIG